MGMKHTRVPKISRHEKSSTSTFIKRRGNRLLRRAARLNPAQAPTKIRHFDCTEDFNR